MIFNKSLVSWNGISISIEKFTFLEGLQQGTANSPIIFNIYTSDLLKLFNINSNSNTSAIAFSDDVILDNDGKQSF